MKGSSLMTRNFVVRFAVSVLIAIMVFLATPFMLGAPLGTLGLIIWWGPSLIISRILHYPVYLYFPAVTMFILAFWLLGYYLE